MHLSLSLTGEGVATSGWGWSHHMPLSVLYYKIGNLVQEHGAEVILLQEVVRCQPGVLRHIVRQLHGRPSLVHIDGEHVVVLLGEDQEDVTSAASQVWSLTLSQSSSSLTFPSYITLLEVCWFEPPTTSPIFIQRPSLTLH